MNVDVIVLEASTQMDGKCDATEVYTRRPGVTP